MWLLVEGVELFQRVDAWIRDLVEMERRWCRRLHLEAEVFAYSPSNQKLSRVAMAVDGPGAASLLAMEEGVHRLSVPRGADLKVRVRILPRGARVGKPVSVVRARKSANVLGLEAAFRGQLQIEERGVVEEWLGRDEEGLSELLKHLARAAASSAPAASDLARIYARDGAGARDPRTGARHPRFKDVLKGDLEAFLAAWRERRAGG